MTAQNGKKLATVLIDILGANYLSFKDQDWGNDELNERKTVIFHAGRAQGNTTALIYLLNSQPLRSYLYPKILIVVHNNKMRQMISGMNDFPISDKNIEFKTWDDEPWKLYGANDFDLIIVHTMLYRASVQQIGGWIRQQNLTAKTILILE